MQAKELRIGNIITDGVISPLVVYEVSDEILKGRYIQKSEDFGISKFNVNFCEGIPLTEEWLLKFGAYKAENNWYRLSGMPSINKELLTLSINLSTFVVCVFGDEALEPAFMKGCKYVHSFQNLYHSLYGKELTFNN